MTLPNLSHARPITIPRGTHEIQYLKLGESGSEVKAKDVILQKKEIE